MKFAMFQKKKKKKKMSLIGQVFVKWLTPKYVLIEMDKRASCRKPVGSERVN